MLDSTQFTIEGIKKLRNELIPTSLTFVKSSLYREYIKNKEEFAESAEDIVHFLLAELDKKN